MTKEIMNKYLKAIHDKIEIGFPQVAGISPLNSLSPTTHNFRNIDKNKQKWYNRRARKKTEKSKKACT